MKECCKKSDGGASPARYSCGNRLRVQALSESCGSEELLDRIVKVCGWSRTVRVQGRGKVFVDLDDGSCATPVQVVVDISQMSPQEAAEISAIKYSFSLKVVGKVVRNLKDSRKLELKVDGADGTCVVVYGKVDQASYPLSKNAPTLNTLRSIQHLRPRFAVCAAVFRIRSQLAFATHQFFQGRGFQYVHTPIITAADCEGAGQMFQVTTLLPEGLQAAKLPATGQGAVDYSKDFFGRPVSLTVSGQLAVENFCHALCDVYTFGPTFRAEISHTSRHLAEFWMIEPEMAFAELEDNMECAEAFVKFCVQFLLDRAHSDLAFLDAKVERGLLERLTNIVSSRFARITYTEAVEMLRAQKEVAFELEPVWGDDLCSAHERYLSEVVFKKPVIVTDYPYALKAFYMKLNPGGKTVRAMDVLVPKIGELIGGSQREENLELLLKQMEDKHVDKAELDWYLDLRKFGSVPHSGFGLGFERLVMLCTGMENIRDVIPYPRYVGNALF